MTEHSDNPREESGVHRLAALLRGDATHAVDHERDEAEWRMLLRVAHEDDEHGLRRRGPSRLWLLAPLAACAVLVAGWGLYRGFSAPSPLRFNLDGREPASEYVASEDVRPRQMAFSDGSTLVLHASGRLRVTVAHSHGATLLLERGRLDVSIRHHPSTRWRLEVGPYVVEVTGTRFDVTWDPDAGDFGVDLLEGAVHISGPGISTPIPLQIGQQFRANQAGNYAVQRQPQTAPASPPTMTEPTARPSATAKATRVASAAGPERAGSPSGHDKPACDWTGLVSSGQFEATVSEAQRLGIETTLAECPTRSLFALADAARYLGKFDLSKSALVAIRKRAPDDRSKAAFFLGRLAEASGNLELALGWYSQAMEGKADPQFAEEANAGTARVTKRIRSVDSRPSHVAP
jgi:ferric-dicitrate binding protein FerR (iron transport regulator)